MFYHSSPIDVCLFATAPTVPGQIISLGTGADFVEAKKLGPGRTVVDSHGLVAAKRSFQR